MSDHTRTVDAEGYVYWHGICANCGRDRDDLFEHAQDGAFYCQNVFRCEMRWEILQDRDWRRLCRRMTLTVRDA